MTMRPLFTAITLSIAASAGNAQAQSIPPDVRHKIEDACRGYAYDTQNAWALSATGIFNGACTHPDTVRQFTCTDLEQVAENAAITQSIAQKELEHAQRTNSQYLPIIRNITAAAERAGTNLQDVLNTVRRNPDRYCPPTS